MFPVSSPAQIDLNENEKGKGKGKGKASTQGTPTATKSRLIEESSCLLTSVTKLRQNVVKNKHRRKYSNPHDDELAEQVLFRTDRNTPKAYFCRNRGYTQMPLTYTTFDRHVSRKPQFTRVSRIQYFLSTLFMNGLRIQGRALLSAGSSSVRRYE